MSFRPERRPRPKKAAPKKYRGSLKIDAVETPRMEERPRSEERRSSRRTPQPRGPRPPMIVEEPRSRGRETQAAERTGRPEGLHVASLEVLSAAVIDAARVAESAVDREHKRADRVIAQCLRGRRDLAAPDLLFVSQAVFALFRWRGWVDGLNMRNMEERLLLSWLLDAPFVHPVCRFWARQIGRDGGRLVAFGDAPGWTGRAEALKRWVDGRVVNADPWRLFPAWLREVLPLPPGIGSPKAKYLELLDSFQRRPPLWVRAQGDQADAVWKELREAGIKPWVHRQVGTAAKLPYDADVHHLEAFTSGRIEIQDLAAQAVGMVCDPDPGDRWWDACAGAGGKAIQLASLMGGKGVVVASDVHDARLKETVRRARRSPYRNVTTKVHDAASKHLPAKPESFDGVLVDAPCSAIGTWRRNPDARWSFDREAIDRLAALQTHLLDSAQRGVKAGGVLVYSVCTLTPTETTAVVDRFLKDHPGFRLDPFPHPFTGAETPGKLLIWPQDADSDAMFIARFLRTS